MQAGLPETYSKNTCNTNSTFAKIVLVLKKHGKFSSYEH